MRIFASAILLLTLVGCAASQPFVVGVDAAWSVIGPEYVAYLEADTHIDDASRVNRKRTAADLSGLIQQAKGVKPAEAPK